MKKYGKVKIKFSIFKISNYSGIHQKKSKILTKIKNSEKKIKNFRKNQRLKKTSKFSKKITNFDKKSKI